MHCFYVVCVLDVHLCHQFIQEVLSKANNPNLRQNLVPIQPMACSMLTVCILLGFSVVIADS